MSYRFKLLVLLIALATAPAVQAATIYSPKHGSTPGAVPAEGAINAAIFNRIDTRKQWFFSPNILGTSAMFINSMSFRYDSIVTDRARASGTITVDERFNVRLAQFDGQPSRNFDDNIPDAVTVLSGAQSIPFRIGGVEGQTKEFGVTLNFTTPFIYRPGNGWLVVDLFLPAQENFVTFDFVRDNPDTFRLFSLTSTVTGEIQSRAPVVRFEVDPHGVPPVGGGGTGGGTGGGGGAGVSGPVPEPATWAMLVSGFGALGAVMRQRRRTVALATPRSRPAGLGGSW